MQSKLSRISNEVFKFLIIFLLAFVWVNFHLSNFMLSVIISVLISALLSSLLSYLFFKKQNIQKLSQNDKKQIKNFGTQFTYSTLPQNLKLISQIFTAKGISNKTENQFVLLYPNTDYSIIVLPAFNGETINESVVISAYKLAQSQNVTKCLILTTKYTNNAANLASSYQHISITLYNEEQIYLNLVKHTGVKATQLNLFKKTSQKTTLKTFAMLLINKNNTKHYFIGAIFMVFASQIITLNSYYRIFSTVFLILSLFSFISDFIFAPQQKTLNFSKVSKIQNATINKTKTQKN